MARLPASIATPRLDLRVWVEIQAPGQLGVQRWWRMERTAWSAHA